MRWRAVLRARPARGELDPPEKALSAAAASRVIFGRVRANCDLDGAVCAGSQVDVRPVRDVGPLMNMPQPFQILKMDRRRAIS
jgi:hypothetical protein